MGGTRPFRRLVGSVFLPVPLGVRPGLETAAQPGMSIPTSCCGLSLPVAAASAQGPRTAVPRSEEQPRGVEHQSWINGPKHPSGFRCWGNHLGIAVPITVKRKWVLP